MFTKIRNSIAGNIRIGTDQLLLAQIDEILFKSKSIELDENALARVEKSFQFLKYFSRL